MPKTMAAMLKRMAPTKHTLNAVKLVLNYLLESGDVADID